MAFQTGLRNLIGRDRNCTSRAFRISLDQAFLQCFFETVADRLISQPYSLSLTASQCNFILQSAPAMLLVCTFDNSWQHCARMKRNNCKDDKEPKATRDVQISMHQVAHLQVFGNLCFVSAWCFANWHRKVKQLITYDNIIWLVVSTPLKNISQFVQDYPIYYGQKWSKNVWNILKPPTSNSWRNILKYPQESDLPHALQNWLHPTLPKPPWNMVQPLPRQGCLVPVTLLSCSALLNGQVGRVRIVS